VRAIVVTTCLGMGLAVAGCTEGPVVERVPVAAPMAGGSTMVEYDRPKPLPDRATLYERDLPPDRAPAPVPVPAPGPGPERR